MLYDVIEFPYNPIRSFRNGNPFTLAFCRTLRYGNVLVKGGAVDVNAEIANLGPALVAYSYWYHGAQRGGVTLENCPRGLYLSRSERSGRNGYSLRIGNNEVAWWRKVPSAFPNVLKEMLS